MLQQATKNPDLLAGYYQRDVDNSVITIEKTTLRVTISSEPNTSYKLIAKASQLFLGLYELNEIGYEEETLVWIHTSTAERILWKRITADEAVNYLITNPRRQERDGTKLELKSNETNNLRSEDVRYSQRNLNELSWPQVTDPDFIALHIKTIEEIAIGSDVMDEHHHIKKGMELPFILKFLGTIHHETLKKSAQDIVRAIGYKWDLLKGSLIRRYCRRDVLKTSYLRRLQELRFNTLEEHEEFLNQCSNILSIVTQVYPEPAEKRPIIREFISLLPEQIRENVIRQLHEMVHEGDDWETVISFDELHNLPREYSMVGTTISDMIRKSVIAAIETKNICRRNNAPMIQRFNTKSPNASPPQGSQGPNTNIKQTAEPSELKQWTQKFSYPTILRGIICDDTLKIKEVLQKIGEPEYKRIISQSRNGKPGKPYFVIGCRDTDTIEKLKGLLPEGTIEPFGQMTTSKNI